MVVIQMIHCASSWLALWQHSAQHRRRAPWHGESSLSDMPAGSIAETAGRFRNNRAIEAARRRLAITADILPLNDCTVQRLAVQERLGAPGGCNARRLCARTSANCCSVLGFQVGTWYCTEVQRTSVQKRNGRDAAKAAGQPAAQSLPGTGRSTCSKTPNFPQRNPRLGRWLAKSDRGDDTTAPVGDNVDVGAVVRPKGLVLRADGHAIEHGTV